MSWPFGVFMCVLAICVATISVQAIKYGALSRIEIEKLHVNDLEKRIAELEAVLSKGEL